MRVEAARPAGRGRRSGPCSRAGRRRARSSCAAKDAASVARSGWRASTVQRVEMDADGEQDVARDRQLAQRLSLDADEGVGVDVAIGKARRSVGGAVDALDVRRADGRGRRRPGSTSCSARPAWPCEIVEHAVDEIGGARARPETRHRRVDLLQRPAEFFDQRPGRGKAQRTGGQPPAAVVAAHQDQVFLDEQRGRDQRGIAETIGSASCRDCLQRRSPRSRRAGAPVGFGKSRQRDARRADRALRAGRRACRPPRRKPCRGFPHRAGASRRDRHADGSSTSIQSVEIERLQPDGEELRRAVIGRVGGQASAGIHAFLKASNPAAVILARNSVTS